MSLCLLRTATCVHERNACTKFPPARLIHQYVKRQFESFSTLWSTPVSCTADHITATPVKPSPAFYAVHRLLHNSPVAPTGPCHSLAFGTHITPDQTLKKTTHKVFIRYMSTDLPDDKRLNCDQLMNLMKEKKVLLIDVRNRQEVFENPFPGTVNIPVKDFHLSMKAPDQMFKEKFGFAKPTSDDHIVFFCATGTRSFIALRNALQMGFKNFSTSTRYCQAEKAPGKISADKALTYDELVNLIARNELLLIDVREPHELQESGELPGSINIPLNELNSAFLELTNAEFQKKYKTRKPGKNAPLVFSCRSGARSYKALQTALELGYGKAKHYKGGYSEWEERKKQERNKN